MKPRRVARTSIRWMLAGFALAAGVYGAYIAVAWGRYGRAIRRPHRSETDPLLDRVMPVYDVGGRHEIRIAAPADVTLAAAREMDLLQSPLTRVIIRAREVVLGAGSSERSHHRGLLAEVQALGWGVLAEIRDRAIVVGAVTRPWEANVVFRALPPDEFAAFDVAGYVKIVWTLRADPRGPHASLFSTETRVLPTDPDARARFRRYWACFSPGMFLIRWLSLRPLKAEAERRARLGGPVRAAALGER